MDSRLGLVAKAMVRAVAAVVVHWPASRDGLRSPEHELAARGVRWASDPAHDVALAREINAARARRALSVPPVSLAPTTGGQLAA